MVFLQKKSLGANSECNVKKKVAYVLCFRDPKSLRPHSGDRSFCVFAYLIALLEGYFQNHWELIVSAMSKKSGIRIVFLGIEIHMAREW